MFDIDDLEVISRIRLGDKNAYALLVKKYQIKVRGYCANMLSNSAAADDAAQEVFIKAFNSLDRFRAESLFSTWLFRITANHCKDMLRKVARDRSQSLDALIESNDARIPKLLSEVPKGVNLLESQDLLRKLLAKLKPEYREVILLREIQGLTYEEMSKVLECSIDAVKARLKRARKELLEQSRHF